MRANELQIGSLIVALMVLGCSGGDETDPARMEGVSTSGGSERTLSGTTNVGGALSLTGKAVATGGKQSIGAGGTGSRTTLITTATSTKGGSTTKGASTSTGGSPIVSSSPASGGAKATTITTAAGGSVATAGGTTTSTAATKLPKFVGNITTRGRVDPQGLKYSKYWDQITPENEGKWGSVQSNPTAALGWGALDSIYAYTQTNNIIFKQHTFVWGAQQPSGTPTLAQVENWIKSFCQRYPNTKLIDVVNEPPPHTTPSYTANLGAGERGQWPWIVKAFKLARQYCGSAILILNDYNNLEWGDQEQHFIDIVKDIKANGAPIDAVGCQSHGLKGRSTAQVQTNIDKMAKDTGLPVYITEYDIGEANDAAQLTNFQNHFEVFLKTEAVKGITVWGWINGSTWVENTGIVNGTTPRPAMTWLMQQLKRTVPPN